MSRMQATWIIYKDERTWMAACIAYALTLCTGIMQKEAVAARLLDQTSRFPSDTLLLCLWCTRRVTSILRLWRHASLTLRLGRLGVTGLQPPIARPQDTVWACKYGHDVAATVWLGMDGR